MTVNKFLETAKQVEKLAADYLGEYAEYYILEYLNCGNIEFKVPKYKEEKLLAILPDDRKDFHTYMQFCFYNDKWNLCMSHTIRHVGEYKKAQELKKSHKAV